MSVDDISCPLKKNKLYGFYGKIISTHTTKHARIVGFTRLVIGNNHQGFMMIKT